MTKRPMTCAAAAAELARLGDTDLLKRLTFSETDLLTEVPGGFDTYTLKDVLHNWNPDTSVLILRNIPAAIAATMTEDAGSTPRLRVIEPVSGKDVDSLRALFQMTVCQDGTEGRTEDSQMTQLVEAGFTVDRVLRLSTGHAVFDCTAAFTS